MGFLRRNVVQVTTENFKKIGVVTLTNLLGVGKELVWQYSLMTSMWPFLESKLSILNFYAQLGRN